MMAQMQVWTKDDPHKKYKLMDMKTLLDALAEERHCLPDQLVIKSMESYKKMGMDMC